MRIGAWIAAAAATWSVAVAGQVPSSGQLHQHPAIGYQPIAASPIIADAARALGKGASYDQRRGYLQAVLDALDVPVASQILLFSKTGAEQALTSPQNPRAFYFNDRVIVSHVPGAVQLEIAVQDAQGGAHFYTVAQIRAAPPAFVGRDDCLRCHVTVNTMEVPGFIARSMSTGGDGRAHPELGSYNVDHRRDYAERWGGWLVTGAPDTLRHLGNTIVVDPGRKPMPTASEVPTLEGRVPVERYLSPYSDVTALAVFDHQMHAMNLLTRLGWHARVAAAEGAVNLLAGPLVDLLRETADYLLFVDEAPLDGPISGGAGFAEWFSARGPSDARGRSLRQFDRQSRLFRYPVSYMVYAPVATALPDEIRLALFARMREILESRDPSERYGRASAELRAAALEILRETHPDWRDPGTPAR
jgi:hypothetical protein